MTILITRPEITAKNLISNLEQLGKKVYNLPLIEFIPGKDLYRLPYLLNNLLRSEDLVIMLSQQAVYFANLTLKKFNASWPVNLNYYAIGYATALSFQITSKLNINYPKIKENSEELIKLFISKNLKDKKIIICGGNPSRELLKNTLLSFNISVFFIECYKSIKKEYNGYTEAKRLRKLGVDTIVVTSGYMLQQLFNLFSDIDRQEWLLDCKLLVISERLSKIAQAFGWKNIYVTEKANNDSILKTLLKK
ncbi:uroporphyrinogen-III synthase [Candidatus Pantoea edessiphila]|uniref:Uroporphyrinogen-III synthase n=1 Tax=Candidatus Pantoea edessiphila TaxID=2044610 RepID=A0A2P5SVC1_9GAMM|nr:uroporphyrinogen-III synthase [Candidatus Pantoea edessiphila]PPI86279.1 uroporphyrinogen-III synthase [Candidatus Pantoea edessiphila]